MNKITRKIFTVLAATVLVVCLSLQLVVASFGGSNIQTVPPVAAAETNGNVKVSYKAVDGVETVEDFSRTDDSISPVPAPADNDDVTVIIKLKGTSMLEHATEQGITLAQSLENGDGVSNYGINASIRNSAQASLSKYVKEYRYNYTSVLNGFSAVVKYGDIAEIQKNSLVDSVIISNTYLAPEAVTENYVDVYTTGIFSSEGVGYDGTGTVVAVLDTGTDYTHEVFDMELDAQTLAITKDDVAAVAPYLTATRESDVSIDEDDLYLTSKLPYAYDYADHDTNVYPYNSHGTHVAGIIAGKSETITGVATGAQIATFKVFPDEEGGANTESILAALNDAVLLGVDAINMSLGTSCGFSREVDEEGVNEVYDAIERAGICLVVAASNDHSSAYGSTWGNTNLTSNPDSGTVGSPASYAASLAVASISGVKTKYFIADGEQETYFDESRCQGKTDPNDFVAGLLGDREEAEFEYVVIPGIGLSANYQGYDVEGKIAVVKRGTTNFEEKVRVAAEKGAIACIVYNHISGTITMSVGSKEIIPSCFITMDLAAALVSKGSGTIKLSKSYLAGPFMSDFSSWGVLPNLQLSPDITAHGGEIYSAIAGTNKYDTYSGTSMASPNLAGALILVRQAVKELYPDYTTNQIRDESYSRMMSTATIALNQEGNPYSPRKQGAGLADIKNSINTKVYLTVDGSNKPKLSLGDDPKRTGEYELKFNVVNTSGSTVSYRLNPYVFTESVSSDERTVAEKAHMFTDTTQTYAVSEQRQGTAKINGDLLTLSGYGEVSITAKITLSNADKEYLNANFKNGMYVEGYMRLESYNQDNISLSIPYLAFYGDWKDAPILDVSEYEVGESAIDDSVLEEDKLKADVYGTLPYAGFYSATSTDNVGYWGMGSFSYIPCSGYEQPAVLERHASLTTNKDGNYIFYMVSAGLIRGAKKVVMEIRNSSTGELLWEGVDYNARKSRGTSGQQSGGAVMIELDISELGLANNSKYTFNMECFLDIEEKTYNEDGEEVIDYPYGNNNKFSFEFTIDNENPELTDLAVRESKTATGSTHILELTAYDNHYLQGYSLYTYESIGEDGRINGYTGITDGVVPVMSEFNRETTFSFNISNYWSTIMENGGNIAVTLYDYAKNYQLFTVHVEEEADLHIAKIRTANESYTVDTNGQLDLTNYINITANTLDDVNEEDKVYLEGYWYKKLKWVSSDPETVEVNDEGLITGLKEGSAVITICSPLAEIPEVDGEWKDTPTCVKFTINVTATQTQIALSGIEMSADSLTLERGESATITATVKPYNYTGDVKLNWTSTSPTVLRVDEVSEDGMTVTVYALQSGSATIRAAVEGSRISGYCRVSVKNEFLMTNNSYLRSYVGRGDENGVVEIPDDLGIYYIYPQAFAGNEYITKVIIPEGVTTIMERAFLQCSNLEEVVLPSTITTIPEMGFYWCQKLKKINLEHINIIDKDAFWGDIALDGINLENCSYIASHAFFNCSAISELDLKYVGTIGGGAFYGCTGLQKLTIPACTTLNASDEEFHFTNGQTAVLPGAFMLCSGLTELTVYSNSIGDYAFYGCTSLEKVTFMNDVNSIGDWAFRGCESLTDVEFKKSAYSIGSQAFGGTAISSFTLPAGLTILGQSVFNGCTRLATLNVSKDARLTTLNLAAFYNSPIANINVEEGNKYLSSDNGVLYDKAKLKLVAYPIARTATSFTVPNGVKTIGESAFSHAVNLQTINLNQVEYIESLAFAYLGYVYSQNSSGETVPTLRTQVTLSGYDNVKYFGDGAFYRSGITNLPVTQKTEYIGNQAFYYCIYLRDTMLDVPASLQHMGNMAFAACPFTDITFEHSSLTSVGDGAFMNDVLLLEVNFGSLEFISNSMFMYCRALERITIPNTITEMAPYAFAGCDKLARVTLPNKLEYIAPYAFIGTALTSVTIPDSVLEIGPYAFAQTQLTQINLNNVEAVGRYAFAEIETLKSVTANNLVYVDGYAFAACTELTSISLPVAQYIGVYAFLNDANLATVSTPEAIIVDAAAFRGCTALTSMTLDNAEYIGSLAFAGATNLSSLSLASVKEIGSDIINGTKVTVINLPATLENVSDGAFYGADGLTAINVAEGDNAKYISDSGVLYLVNDNGFHILSSYPAGKTATNYSVLDTTIKVNAYSFNRNPYLQELTLSVYLQVIGARAFSGMTALSEITLKAVAAPTLESLSVVDVEGETEEDTTYVNVYQNFNFDFGESGNLKIIVPANGTGYDDYIWKKYVGQNVEASNEYHVTLGTLTFIRRVNALPANPTSADAQEIAALIRLYNMINTAQRIFVRGGEYNNGKVTVNGVEYDIDVAYYTQFLGGVDYYQILQTANSKLNSAAASQESFKTPVNVNGEPSVQFTVLTIVAVFSAAIAVCAVVAIVVAKRRKV